MPRRQRTPHGPGAAAAADARHLLFGAALAAACRPIPASRWSPLAPERGLVDEVLAAAAQEHLDGMVAVGLASLGVDQAWLHLGERRRQAAVRALTVQLGRDRVQTAFSRRGCRPVFLKGGITDALFFGGEGLRGTRDLDVVVASRELPAAEGALLDLGYRRHLEPRRRASEQAKPARLYLHPDRVAFPDVDMHLGLLKSPPYRECVHEVLPRAELYLTPHGAFYGLSREDMLAHAAGNLAGSKFYSGRWKLALDAAVLLWEGRVDLALVVERTSQWGVSWALWGLLRIVEERLRAPVPQDILAAVRPHRRARMIIERVAGVCAAPLTLHTGSARLWRVDRLVVNRPLWWVEAPLRELALRVQDRLDRPGLNDSTRGGYSEGHGGGASG